VAVKTRCPSDNSIGNQLTRHKSDIRHRSQYASQGNRADLTCVRRRYNNVRAKDLVSLCQPLNRNLTSQNGSYQSSQQLPSQKHRQRPRKELNEDKPRRNNNTSPESLLAAKPLHGIRCEERSNDLADRTTH
jgi:hypothetical protein